MFKLLMKKQRRIQDLIAQYVDQWLACVRCFEAAWQCYVEEGIGESFDFHVEQTHKEESRADDLRRKLELELYGKALLPEGRGDILGVIEAVDRLLTDAEWVLYELQLQSLVIPNTLLDSYQRLARVVCGTCEAIGDAIRVLFAGSGNPEQVRKLTEKVDQLESESDHRERCLIREIFQTDGLATGDKALLKNVVLLMGRVTDRAEHVATRVTLVSIKRKV